MPHTTKFIQVTLKCVRSFVKYHGNEPKYTMLLPLTFDLQNLVSSLLPLVDTSPMLHHNLTNHSEVSTVKSPNRI